MDSSGKRGSGAGKVIELTQRDIMQEKRWIGERKNRSMENKIIQMKVVLEGVVSKIWRSFVVESSISLANLHEIIQIVMGWENMHLYRFSIGGAEAAKNIKLYELNLK